MLLVLELDVADLAATRFAISPLAETTRAIQLLSSASPAAANRPWVRWARAELARQPLRLPRLWPLIVNGLPVHPEFLSPRPRSRRLRWRPSWPGCGPRPPGRSGPACAGCSVTSPGRTPRPSCTDRPAESLAEIAAELGECHDRLIGPHWERIRPVLEADIAYRSGLLADGGARSLFSDLHPDLRWSGGTLTLQDDDAGPSPFRVPLGPDGVVLVPSVFNWPHVSVSKATSSQTILMYPARGTARVWQSGEFATGSTAVQELLGPARARLLTVLRSPATTTALARQLGVTPSAVSQHLAVLHRSGLVDRRRNGRSVLYQTSELGLALLEPYADAGSRFGGTASRA